MVSVIRQLCLLLCLSCSAVWSADWRVIRGEEAIQHEFPSIVTLQVRGGHFCGGTLLNANTVLTAAHCVYNFRSQNPSIISVRAGEHAIYAPNGRERTSYVNRIIIHPLYRDNAWTGDDIALLKLSQPIREEAHIQYAKLPGNGEPSRPGDRCTVVGWGSMDPRGVGVAQRLQKAGLDIVSNDVCGRHFQTARGNIKHVCGGRGEQSISACRGDSGGPLFCNAGGQSVQVGIVSFGKIPCAQANIPAVFTRVSTYVDWIRRQ